MQGGGREGCWRCLGALVRLGHRRRASCRRRRIRERRSGTSRASRLYCTSAPPACLVYWMLMGSSGRSSASLARSAAARPSPSPAASRASQVEKPAAAREGRRLLCWRRSGGPSLRPFQLGGRRRLCRTSVIPRSSGPRTALPPLSSPPPPPQHTRAPHTLGSVGAQHNACAQLRQLGPCLRRHLDEVAAAAGPRRQHKHRHARLAQSVRQLSRAVRRVYVDLRYRRYIHRPTPGNKFSGAGGRAASRAARGQERQAATGRITPPRRGGAPQPSATRQALTRSCTARGAAR
jgi:hypothetical protein